MHNRQIFLTLIMIASIPLAHAGPLHDVAEVLESEGGWNGKTKDGKECHLEAGIEGGLFGRLVIALESQQNSVHDSIASADELYNFKKDSSKIYLQTIDRGSYYSTSRHFDIKLSNNLPISVKAELNETDRSTRKVKSLVIDCLNLRKAN